MSDSKPRFTVEVIHTTVPNGWMVMDASTGYEVFYYYGATALDKCNAVAEALNNLNHGDE